MVRHDTYAKVLRAEEHQAVLAAEFMDQVFGVAREAEAHLRNCVFVERSGDEGVDGTAFGICHSGLQGDDGGPGAVGCGLADFHGHAFGHGVDDVDAFGTGIFGGVDHIGRHLLDIGQKLAVNAEETGGAVKHDDAVLEDACIRQCLDNNLISYTIGITLRDTYHYLVFHELLNFPQDTKNPYICVCLKCWTVISSICRAWGRSGLSF